jgi:hypothetical protein
MGKGASLNADLEALLKLAQEDGASISPSEAFHDWTDKEEAQLAEMGEHAAVYAWLFGKSYAVYSTLDALVTLPSILVLVVGGVVKLLLQHYNAAPTVQLVVDAVALAGAGVVGTSRKAKLPQSASAYKAAADGWDRLHKVVALMLGLRRDQRNVSCSKFGYAVGVDYNRLMVEAGVASWFARQLFAWRQPYRAGVHLPKVVGAVTPVRVCADPPPRTIEPVNVTPPLEGGASGASGASGNGAGGGTASAATAAHLGLLQRGFSGTAGSGGEPASAAARRAAEMTRLLLRVRHNVHAVLATTPDSGDPRRQLHERRDSGGVGFRGADRDHGRDRDRGDVGEGEGEGGGEPPRRRSHSEPRCSTARERRNSEWNADPGWEPIARHARALPPRPPQQRPQPAATLGAREAGGVAAHTPQDHVALPM